MRFGLIGCGGIGALRAAAISQMPDIRLVAVNDVDKSRAQSLAAHFGAVVEEDWRNLVRRIDLDAVIVSTPHAYHAEQSMAALSAGKHVLCEKPLARNLAECQQMVQAAGENARFLATGFNYRFYPSFQLARKLLTDKLIGELDHIRSYAGYTAADHGQAWLHDVNVVGGGALMDNGIHLIDLTAFFLGGVQESSGYATQAVWGFNGCEDNGYVLMRSPQGKIATLHASWTEWRGYRFQIELYGSRGCIRASCFPMSVDATWSSELGGAKQSKQYRFPRIFFMEHLRSYRWVVVQSFIEEIQAFARACAGEPSEVASGEDGLEAVKVAQQVYRVGA